MSFWKWSTTAANNSTADSTINWAEGQAPSTVNDSARAMMAAAAKFRDDVSGSLTTSGTSSAFTLSSNQVFDTLAHMHGAVLAFVPHATSAVTPTLAVDGLTAKTIRSAPGIDLPAGVLIQGTPYVVTYNNSDGYFYLHGGIGAFEVPIGGMIPYLGATAPNSNFVFPFGQAISRTTYATLFAMVSTSFGTGDGSTTFNIPDLRGRLPIGKDNMGGSAANRVTTSGSSIDGTTLGATGGAENVTLAQANLPNINLTTSISAGQGSHTHGPGIGNNFIIRDTGAGGQQLQTSPGVVSDGTAGATAAATLPSMTGSTPTGGSGTAVNKMPPGIVVPYILRVI